MVPYIRAAGCIRFMPRPSGSGDRPVVWHVNTAHSRVGFVDTPPVVNADGNIVLALEPGPDGDHPPVLYTAATHDEAFAKKGIIAGVSSGVETMTISLREEGFGPLDLDQAPHYDRIPYGTSANLWVTVLAMREPLPYETLDVDNVLARLAVLEQTSPTINVNCGCN